MRSALPRKQNSDILLMSPGDKEKGVRVRGGVGVRGHITNPDIAC